MATILVTGAAGFIGSHITDALLEADVADPASPVALPNSFRNRESSWLPTKRRPK